MLKLSQKNIKEISELVNENQLRLNFLSGHTNKIFMAFVFLFFSINLMFVNSSFANPTNIDVPSYDSISVTPRTWQQVELKYSDVINGKKYPAEVKLLRPIKWLQENDMSKIGNEVTLSIPEFGVIHVKATVTSIKPTTLDTSKINWSKIDSRPVIGTFKRYAPVVKTYTFKDVTTGEISAINATPNHPFYVKNKAKFIPIEDVTPTDQLVNSSGQTVKLLCRKDQISHCGKIYNTDGKPVLVYNLEVYQKHHYYIGFSNLLVHNICGELMSSEQHSDLFNQLAINPESKKTILKVDSAIYKATRSKINPDYVYRVDSRPINIISKEGFKPWNSKANISLEEYVSNGIPSQYISTTSNLDYMLSELKLTKTDAYLYKIKFRSDGIYVPHEMSIRPTVRLKYFNQSEYAFSRSIPPSDIVDAFQIRCGEVCGISY